MVIASTIAERQSTDPTDRSMPPEMMTTVMPSAMMPTKAKLRVTLNRFCGVAKVSVSAVSARQASNAAMKTQNACWPNILPRRRMASGCSIASSISLDRHVIALLPHAFRHVRSRR